MLKDIKQWENMHYSVLCLTCLLFSSQYNAVDTSPLSVYIMQPIWNKIIKIVPLWVAPNVLTFSGFVMILVNYFLISSYDWDYTASDSIDGKHARRTQSSTPLGELFDHGLDSWATSIFVLSFFSVCSRDNGKSGISVYTMYIYLSIVLFNFMCSHWEKYNTGVLFLPWGYDISQVVSIYHSCFGFIVFNCVSVFIMLPK
uniref:Ethanolaminephosphotransferase 1-like protein n=1 Tax=Amazona collaria TaxID=241587 RepID=A0A8B9FS64_9PSIT